MVRITVEFLIRQPPDYEAIPSQDVWVSRVPHVDECLTLGTGEAEVTCLVKGVFHMATPQRAAPSQDVITALVRVK